MDSAAVRQCTGHFIGWSAATIKEQNDQKQYVKMRFCNLRSADDYRAAIGLALTSAGRGALTPVPQKIGYSRN